jgi:site-specific recombinase XerD
MTGIAHRQQQALSTELNIESARKYAQSSQAENTMRAYKSAFNRWCLWAVANERPQLPADPSDVAVYMSHLADSGKAWATINTALAAIEFVHTQKGLSSIRTSREVITVGKGIRRTIGTAQVGAKSLSVEDLRKICSTFGNDLIDVRNKAILLLGFTGAFRRSEIVSLSLTDINRKDDGYLVTLRRSKTDQDGKGMTKGIPFGSNPLTCPVTALDRWIAKHPHAETKGTLLFCTNNGLSLSDWSVNYILKQSMLKAGLDPTGYSAHSLRVGFVTAAAKADKRLDQIMEQTGHKSVEITMKYVRAARTIKDSAVNGIGV